MAIISMVAFGDFDERYNVNIVDIQNKELSTLVCSVLNSFCLSLPGCGKDVLMSKYLVHEEWKEKLRQKLHKETGLSYTDIILIVSKIVNVCINHNIYIYSDTFSWEDILSIV